jgi:hypothetical protein
MARGEGTRVLMAHQGNLGYAPDQIETSVTLADLLEKVQEAVDEHGEDAVVVLQQTNNGHGANYGKLYSGYGLFEAVEEEFDEDDETGGGRY